MLKDSLRALTAGLNFREVSTFYQIEGSKEGNIYHIRLTPKTSSVKKLVRSVDLVIDDNLNPQRVNIEDAKGQKSRLLTRTCDATPFRTPPLNLPHLPAPKSPHRSAVEEIRRRARIFPSPAGRSSALWHVILLTPSWQIQFGRVSSVGSDLRGFASPKVTDPRILSASEFGLRSRQSGFCPFSGV